MIAEIALKGVNVDDEADKLGRSNLQLAAIYHEAPQTHPDFAEKIGVVFHARISNIAPPPLS
ncbi:MAG: hypothetical protein ACE5IR_25755 [bacterium]